MTPQAKTYAAFLRGINLGRRRRVSATELRSLFAELGFSCVATFRTSGNLIFTATAGSMVKTTNRIQQGLSKSLGFEVTVFLRSAAEMRALAAHQPFTPSVVKRSKGKLQVILLAASPPARVRKNVLGLANPADRLDFGKRELFWLPSAGTRNSALDVKAIEAEVGVTTMRTKGTIDEFAAKYFATRRKDTATKTQGGPQG
jgi:uncharacterized protein (DUF1697 family)